MLPIAFFPNFEKMIYLWDKSYHNKPISFFPAWGVYYHLELKTPCSRVLWWMGAWGQKSPFDYWTQLKQEQVVAQPSSCWAEHRLSVGRRLQLQVLREAHPKGGVWPPFCSRWVEQHVLLLRSQCFPWCFGRGIRRGPGHTWWCTLVKGVLLSWARLNGGRHGGEAMKKHVEK